MLYFLCLAIFSIDVTNSSFEVNPVESEIHGLHFFFLKYFQIKCIFMKVRLFDALKKIQQLFALYLVTTDPMN